jgi:hypothetical protein
MNKLTKPQMIALIVAALNLMLVFLFPPFNDYSVSKDDIPIFAGFYWVFSPPANYEVNGSLLYLEVAVILINLAIFWLITNEGGRRRKGKNFNYRKISMIIVAINLIGVLLFPPFEYISNMSKAVIPTFEGFYFIFAHPPYRAIVTPVLYLEVMMILVNGGLLLLLFKDKSSAGLGDTDKALAYMAKIKSEATGNSVKSGEN